MTQHQDATEWLSLIQGGETVGYVLIVDCDNFHMIGRFRAGEAFAKHEALFAEVYRRWAADTDDWLEALEAVNILDFRLENASGWVRAIRDFHFEHLEEAAGSEGILVSFKFTKTA